MFGMANLAITLPTLFIVFSNTLPVAAANPAKIPDSFEYLVTSDDGETYFGKVLAVNGNNTVIRVKSVSSDGKLTESTQIIDCIKKSFRSGLNEPQKINPNTVASVWHQFACR